MFLFYKHNSHFLKNIRCISSFGFRLKRLPPMRETWVWSLGQEDPLEKEMVTHSSNLAWRISWTGKPGRLQSMGSQRVGHDWATSLFFISFLSLHFLYFLFSPLYLCFVSVYSGFPLLPTDFFVVCLNLKVRYKRLPGSFVCIC